MCVPIYPHLGNLYGLKESRAISKADPADTTPIVVIWADKGMQQQRGAWDSDFPRASNLHLNFTFPFTDFVPHPTAIW